MTIHVANVDITRLGFGAFKPASDETAGVRGMVMCTRCGKTLIAQSTIPAGTEICIPASVKTIDTEAFMNTAASQLRIDEGITSIGSMAFANCDQLLLAILPDTLTAIADDAFTSCDNMVILCSTGNTVVLEWAAAHGFYVRAIDR